MLSLSSWSGRSPQRTTSILCAFILLDLLHTTPADRQEELVTEVGQGAFFGGVGSLGLIHLQLHTVPVLQWYTFKFLDIFHTSPADRQEELVTKVKQQGTFNRGGWDGGWSLSPQLIYNSMLSLSSWSGRSPRRTTSILWAFKLQNLLQTTSADRQE